MNKEEFEAEAKRIQQLIKDARKAFDYEAYGCKYESKLDEFAALAKSPKKIRLLQAELIRLNYELRMEKSKGGKW